jgi:hypothetical protein
VQTLFERYFNRLKITALLLPFLAKNMMPGFEFQRQQIAACNDLVICNQQGMLGK